MIRLRRREFEYRSNVFALQIRQIDEYFLFDASRSCGRRIVSRYPRWRTWTSLLEVCICELAYPRKSRATNTVSA
jgi:hypothetical protein